MISLVQAAEIADRLWHANRAKFHRECDAARAEGTTLLELIRRRIAARLDARLPYVAYEVAS